MVVAASLEFDMSSLKLIASVLFILPALAMAELQVVVLEGLGGEERYTEEFAAQIAAIEVSASALTSHDRVRVFRNGEFSRDAVIEFFVELRDRMSAEDRLAVFLIGHGSYDDHEYKFNMAGPDITGSDLKDMLDDLPGSNQLIVNTSSASGAITGVA